MSGVEAFGARHVRVRMLSHARHRHAGTLSTWREPLPAVASPTAALFAAGFAVWLGAAWAAVTGWAPWWLTVPSQALVTVTMFTVAHETVHHVAGRLTWVNEALGRLATPFVAVHLSFPLLRHAHLRHHRNTNNHDADPSAWNSHGPGWLLPLRWATSDLRQLRFARAHATERPGEEAETLLLVAIAVAGCAALVVGGHGWHLLLAYLLPQRLGLVVLAWWFDWLPHHDLPGLPEAPVVPRGEEATDRFAVTRVRVGLEWLLTPLTMGQNYHLVHHLHPTVPFYRYLQVWRDNRAAYLDHDIRISTPRGRELTTAEYRVQARLAEPAPAAPATVTTVDGPDFHSLTVSELRRVAPDAVAVSLAVPAELRPVFAHRPGQHVVLRSTVNGRSVRRAYALGTKSTTERLELVVRRVPGGIFSGHVVASLRAGDVLDVSPPRGGLTLSPEPSRARYLVAIAAGVGMTPVLPVVTGLLTGEPGSRVTLLYVNRSGATTLFADEVGDLARRFEGRLHVVHYRTDERDPDLHPPRQAKPLDAVDKALAITHERYQRGRLDGTRLRALLHGRLHPAKVTDWLLCSPPGLLDICRRTLAEEYVPDDSVHCVVFDR